MSSKSIIDQAKLANWASLFSDQKASGLSVTEWCLQNSISKNKFFYWKRKLKDIPRRKNIRKSLPPVNFTKIHAGSSMISAEV